MISTVTIMDHESIVFLTDRNKFIIMSGTHLCSHIVTNVVFSAGHVLTVVFGMGTGVTHDRINTRNGTKWTRTTDLTLIRRAL